MDLSFRGRCAWAALLLMTSAGAVAAAEVSHGAPTSRPAMVRNLVRDYGAGRGASGEIAEVLQRAVDEVGAAGGGTIVLPARVGGWTFRQPVFIGWPDVTIAGEGAGTRLSGASLFVLGGKAQYSERITDDHYPLISGADAGVLDGSVRQPRYGLRTTDGRTAASGYFPACPLAFGYKVQRDPSGNYWKDYEVGAGKPTYWRNWPRYTIELAVHNNASAPMRGTICGVGAGGIAPAETLGDISDPLTVWTIQSDPQTGRELAFKFKTVDAAGHVTVQALPLSAQPAGKGTHRVSVQLDFTTGACRAWYSASENTIVQPTLAGKLDLGVGLRLKAFEYGAFQLGRVTGRAFSGSPAASGVGLGGEGDWTFCGASLFSTARYSNEHDADRSGAGAVRIDDPRAPPDDAYRYFPSGAAATGLITYLPLDARPTAQGNAALLVPYRVGPSYGDPGGAGYWLPQRRPEPVRGTITLRDMQVFASGSNCGAPIIAAEAEHVVLENIYEGGGGYHGIGCLPLDGLDRRITLHNCRLVGTDASLFTYDQTIDAQNLSGGGGETMFRLVGGRGAIDHVVVTGFVGADYYAKFHAGARGGPLRISEFCIDNEGLGWVPHHACFYAEPSLDGGPDGNRLSFPGTIYTGALSHGQSVIELADAPAPPQGVHRDDARATAILSVDGVDLMASPKKPAGSIILSHTNRWRGDLWQAETPWTAKLTSGVIRYTAAGACGIVSHHDDADALPTQGTWLAGCHVFQIPDRQDPATGAWRVRTYRCVQGGTYGTAQEPRWEEAPQEKR